MGIIERSYRRQASLDDGRRRLTRHVKNLREQLGRSDTGETLALIARCQSSLEGVLTYLPEERRIRVRAALRSIESVQRNSNDAQFFDRSRKLLSELQREREALEVFCQELRWRPRDAD